MGDNSDPDIEDGVPNEETASFDPSEFIDSDGDVIGDNSDPDRDGDGVSNDVDLFPDDVTESSDSDGDGIGDNSDTDIDGDGVPNTSDRFLFDLSESLDTDGMVWVTTPMTMMMVMVSDTDDIFPLDPSESMI